MWVFLLTEILFFGGLFIVYTIYRVWYPEAFAAASHHLDIPLGTINTAVLIGSSLTMALAVHAAQLNSRKGDHRVHRADDGARQRVPRHQGRRVLAQVSRAPDPGPALRVRAPVRRQAQIFFSLYFMMTGMHALHMIIGMGLMIWMLIWAYNGTLGDGYYSPVEIVGLYWHFVDIVWIFLFPLLYLIGRHG